MTARRLFRITLFCLVNLTSTSAISAESDRRLPTRDAIVKHQEHFEALVTSVSAEFDSVHTPTREEDVPRIKALLLSQYPDLDRDEYKRYLLSPSVASARSYSAKWFRDGLRVRLEYYSLGQTRAIKPIDVIAFDGGAVRRLQGASTTKPTGEILSMENAHWNGAPKVEPFNLLWYCYGTPWSNVMRESPQFDVERYRNHEGGSYKVTFGNKRLEGILPTTYVMLVDEQLNVIQRDRYRKFPEDKIQRIYERITFSELEDEHVEGGEIISIPKKCRIQRVVGVTSKGELATYEEEELTIRNITLNPQLDDSLFTIDFPPGIAIVDRLQDFQSLSTGETPGPSVAKRSRWLLLINLVVIVTIVVLLILRARRAKSAPNS